MDMVGLDTEFLNAQFACIEIDQGDPFNPDTPIHTGEIQKMLTIYQLELGMNNVNRHSTEKIPESANMLIAGNKSLRFKSRKKIKKFLLIVLSIFLNLKF